MMLYPGLCSTDQPLSEIVHFTNYGDQTMSVKFGISYRTPYLLDIVPTDYCFFRYFNQFLIRKHLNAGNIIKFAFQEFTGSCPVG